MEKLTLIEREEKAVAELREQKKTAIEAFDKMINAKLKNIEALKEEEAEREKLNLLVAHKQKSISKRYAR